MKEANLKKLIQHIGLNDQGGSFTDSVMKTIEIEDELSMNPALLSVLKSELLAEPCSDFTDNLMLNIQANANKISQPILNKKIKLIFSGIIILILILVVINPHSNLSHLHRSYFSRLDINLSDAITGIIKAADSVLPYFIPLSILLLLDYLFRTKRSRLIS